jgi:glutamate dehydrogenase (NADP+)
VSSVDHFVDGLEKRNPNEPEFLQAVREFAIHVMPLVEEREDLQRAEILERMTEPDRIVIFRVTWQDDGGRMRANRAWRVQFNNSLGPYKGGLRFGTETNLSVLKFLGFEQTFKNALTGLPMGGAKGGSNFNPKGKSEAEVMRFCQSLMTELQRHIGEDVDIPAGDIGVGGREIAWLFGQYKRIRNRFGGVLTGKGLSFGGSAVRTEATGYGAVYFAERMLAHADDDLSGKTCALSGAGNVSIYCAEKLAELGARVVTLSDSGGTVHDPDGIDEDKLRFVRELKLERRGRISEYAEEYGCDYLEGERPWGVECDMAFPCATQNELDEDDAKALAENGCRAVVEGANMPATSDAATLLREKKVLFAPGKAANAGGVAVSGLEQSQNAVRIAWSREEVDERLRQIMDDIHRQCVDQGDDGDYVDYAQGADRAAFQKVAEAMLAYGAV